MPIFVVYAGWAIQVRGPLNLPVVSNLWQPLRPDFGSLILQSLNRDFNFFRVLNPGFRNSNFSILKPGPWNFNVPVLKLGYKTLSL